jgi:hypothetical protein
VGKKVVAFPVVAGAGGMDALTPWNTRGSAQGGRRLGLGQSDLPPNSPHEPKSYTSSSAKVFQRNKIDWPSVYLTEGWNDAARAFNLDGYGLVLVDAQGIVRKINPRGDEIESAVGKVLGDLKRSP